MIAIILAFKNLPAELGRVKMLAQYPQITWGVVWEWGDATSQASSIVNKLDDDRYLWYSPTYSYSPLYQYSMPPRISNPEYQKNMTLNGSEYMLHAIHQRASG